MQSQLIPGDGPTAVEIPVITAACGKSVRISTVSGRRRGKRGAGGGGKRGAGGRATGRVAAGASEGTGLRPAGAPTRGRPQARLPAAAGGPARRGGGPDAGDPGGRWYRSMNGPAFAARAGRGHTARHADPLRDELAFPASRGRALGDGA